MDAVGDFFVMVATALGAGLIAGGLVCLLGAVFLGSGKRDESWMVAWALLVILTGVGTFGGMIGWSLAS